MNVKLVCGDITTFDGDVTVNAANPVMLGGGGVDGAIHRAAGPGLKDACEQVPCESGPDGPPIRCSVSMVRPTPAFDLPAKWVFHTAGPIFNLKRAGELRPGEENPCLEVSQEYTDTLLRQQLRDCYKHTFIVAVGMGLKSVAFPAISTGVYGCPHEVCADTVMKLCADYDNWPLEITVYLFPADSYGTWVGAYRKHLGKDPA